jgi:hypothetical protein
VTDGGAPIYVHSKALVLDGECDVPIDADPKSAMVRIGT